MPDPGVDSRQALVAPGEGVAKIGTLREGAVFTSLVRQGNIVELSVPSARVLPQSIRTLAALFKLASVFGESIGAVYDVDTLQRLAKQREQEPLVGTPSPSEGSTRNLSSSLRLGRYNSGILEKFISPDFARRKQALLAGLSEMAALREEIPHDLIFLIDDKSPSTDFRGRLVTKININKASLDQAFRADDLEFVVNPTLHKMELRQISTGETVTGRLPYLLEGTRVYERDGVYEFENFALLDAEERRLFGKSVQFSRRLPTASNVCELLREGAQVDVGRYPQLE